MSTDLLPDVVHAGYSVVWRTTQKGHATGAGGPRDTHRLRPFPATPSPNSSCAENTKTPAQIG
jgi:hypothetical protein